MTSNETMRMAKLVIPATSSSYPSLGVTYRHPRHEIEYSPRLVLTGKDYYASKAGVPEGFRMSTAAEELAIQRGLKRSGKDPRKEAVFNDLFGGNASPFLYGWKWTETGLRVPKGWDPAKHERHPDGREYWVRELLIGDEVIGEILVPEGNGRVAVEWDEVFGIPRVTERIELKHGPHMTQFWFNPKPVKNGISGAYDVSVRRRGDWLDDVAGRYGDVSAVYVRSHVDLGNGFRPVRGSLPKIKRK